MPVSDRPPAPPGAPLSEPPPPQDYDTLKGKTGRQALHRPDRFALRDLVDAPEDFSLFVGGHKVRAHNLSLSGLSFADKSPHPWLQGAATDYAFHLNGVAVLEGRATVARVKQMPRHSEVGLTTSGALDYERLRLAEQDLAWTNGLLRSSPRVLKDVLPADHRTAVLELSAFCQYHSELLGRRELLIGSHAQDRQAIAREAFEPIRKGWTELRREASLTAHQFLAEPATLRAARALAESLVTTHLVRAPVLRQAFDKPLGYPGDYVVMQHYFAQAFAGDSAFGMVFNQITNQHPLSAGVRTRAQHVADAIAVRADRVNGSGPLRAMSVGCGIAAEVGMVHDQHSVPTSAVEWTLIDQEDRALTVAHRSARSLLPAESSPPQLRCLNKSFARLMRGEENPMEWGTHDVIFALGLFDYLKPQPATLFASMLYSLLQPGGVLFIANAIGPNDHLWEPELALRWHLLYRDKGEIEGLTKGLPDDATISLVAEPHEAYHILSCHKP